jgi:hypothetical protein
LINDLRGRRCSSIRRFQHRIGDQPSSEFGPLELGWADGRFTTLDANADWTLDIAARAWSDPFADVPADERLRITMEMGVWEPSPPSDELTPLIGRTVTALEPILNEVGEFARLEITFGDIGLTAAVESGNLMVSVRRP